MSYICNKSTASDSADSVMTPDSSNLLLLFFL